MTFRDREYAATVWTADKIETLEAGWEKQKEGWYKLLSPLIPDNLTNTIDVGCGVGMYYDLLSSKSSFYVGVDPVESMVNRAKERRPEGNWRIGSVYLLPFPNDSFDLAFCWSVLVHLPHETIEKALKELWRVTRKHLLFNLYMSLDDPSFSVRGSWGEYLTAMDEMWISKTLRKLSPRTWRIKPYEPIEKLDGKRFQRYIYLLRKEID